MIDWPGIFERDVAPILANFSAPVPTPVLAVAAVVLLVGVALLGLLSFPRNLYGFIPIALVIFGGVMVRQDDAEPLHLAKHPVVDGEQQIVIVVDELPAKAGVDPYHKLIDRHLDDNVVAVEAPDGA